MDGYRILQLTSQKLWIHWFLDDFESLARGPTGETTLGPIASDQPCNEDTDPDRRWKRHHDLPSGKPTKNYGKSQFLMGKLTISMVIFNSYVKLPEGNR
jgi:hypothetical protein